MHSVTEIVFTYAIFPYNPRRQPWESEREWHMHRTTETAWQSPRDWCSSREKFRLPARIKSLLDNSWRPSIPITREKLVTGGEEGKYEWGQACWCLGEVVPQIKTTEEEADRLWNASKGNNNDSIIYNKAISHDLYRIIRPLFNSYGWHSYALLPFNDWCVEWRL